VIYWVIILPCDACAWSSSFRWFSSKGKARCRVLEGCGSRTICTRQCCVPSLASRISASKSRIRSPCRRRCPVSRRCRQKCRQEDSSQSASLLILPTGSPALPPTGSPTLSPPLYAPTRLLLPAWALRFCFRFGFSGSSRPHQF
jgi:hypothetical protein